MAERKQVNKYYPPDFDPAKHKSINKYQNSHPLRERAKKLSQGILVIRFEMPYNIWCGGCGNHVGMGVRYNAEKKKVGKYYTTPIYQFKMKCHLCDNYIVMETDPKNFDYTIISGAQRKNQKWDMAENEQVLTEDREAVKKLSRDAMYKLEHGVDDTKKLKKAAPSLSKIAEIQSAKKDDYAQNQALRKKFRVKKKELLAEEASDNALLSKSSLEIELVPEAEEDKKLASLLNYSVPESYEEKREQKRESIQSRNIFAPSTVSSPNSIEISPRSSSSSSQSSSSSSSSSRPSGAQQTLINKVMRKASVSIFGSKSSSRSSGLKASAMGWMQRTTKSLICGTKGIILKRKRKRSEDDAAVISTEVNKKSKLSDRVEISDAECGLPALDVARNESVGRDMNIKDAKSDRLDVDDADSIHRIDVGMVDRTRTEHVPEIKMSSTAATQQSMEGGSVRTVQIHSSSTVSSPSPSVSSERTAERPTADADNISVSKVKVSFPSHTPCMPGLGEHPSCSVHEEGYDPVRANRAEGSCSHDQIRTADTASAIAGDAFRVPRLPSPDDESEGEEAVGTDSHHKSSLSLVSCYSSSSDSEVEL